jgi:hypothetical protein
MFGVDWSEKQTFALRGRRRRFARCGWGRAWTGLRGVWLRTRVTVHHNRLRILGILRVGMVWIAKGGVRERGMLHRVRGTRFDWSAWGPLAGPMLLLLLLLLLVDAAAAHMMAGRGRVNR